MTDAVSLGSAEGMYNQLLIVNQALALITAGSKINAVVLSSTDDGSFVVPLPGVTVPVALTTALTNRQTALRNQLAALGVTNVP